MPHKIKIKFSIKRSYGCYILLFFLVSLHVANLIVFIGCSYSEVGWLFVFAYRTIKPCANAGKDTEIQQTHHIVYRAQTSFLLGSYNKTPNTKYENVESGLLIDLFGLNKRFYITL